MLHKISICTRKRQATRGAAMVEMAFVLPVYLLLCWGFLNFSWILFGYGNATYASKFTARYAAYHGATSASPCSNLSLQTIAKQYLWGTPQNGVTITAAWPSGNSPGNWVSLNIKVVYPTGIPFSSLQSVTIGTTATEIILE
jgi:Flp pilus assembly protein TadG